jgi:hypothetical protein
MIAQAGEVARQVAGRREAVLRVLGEAAFRDPAQRRGRPRVEARDRLRVFADDGGERLGGRRALERPRPGRHLEQDRSERELVAPEVGRLARGLLGRHVADRAEHHARPGDRSRHRGLLRGLRVVQLGQLGEAEVEDLDVAVLRDHDVVGLEVAVLDPCRVRLGERVGHLHGDLERLARRELPAGQQVAQRAALDQLHRDPGDTRVLADVEHRDDVRVVERGGRARLLLEARAPAPGSRPSRRAAS